MSLVKSGRGVYVSISFLPGRFLHVITLIYILIQKILSLQGPSTSNREDLRGAKICPVAVGGGR